MMGRVLGDCGDRNRRPWRQLDESNDLLAPFSFNGSANYGGAHYFRISVEYGLDFGWIDIEPKADDQLFRSPHDEEIPIFHSGKVTGVEPAFCVDGSGGLLWRAIVSLHDVRPSHPQFSHFACRHRIPTSAHQPNLNSRKRPTHRGVRSRLFDPRLRNIGRTLRDAETVVE